MVSMKQFAYSMLVATIAIVPSWGCNTEAPEPPAEVKKAADEAGGTNPPTVELGSASGESVEDTDGTEDKSGSAEGE